MKREPKRPSDRAKFHTGHRRGAAPLVARLSQQGLLDRNTRRLKRAAAAVENAPKDERAAAQGRLFALRSRITTTEFDADGGERTYVLARMSRRP